MTLWQTTNLHTLEGRNPVYEWVQGTTLRPVYDDLDPHDRLEFSPAYCSLLRRAYPEHHRRTIFPLRRLFVVATRQ